MSAKELLKTALHYYSIEIFKELENRFVVAKGYEIEIEKNGMYKLISDGEVVAPFDELDDLCRFILL